LEKTIHSYEIQRYMADIYKIKTKEDHALALKLAESDPEGYLLKPNREGGGHNIYADDMLDKLRNLPLEQVKAFILMEKINPVSEIRHQIKFGKISATMMQSEIGCFGFILSDDNKVLNSGVGGFMIRTKDEKNREGGIYVGASVLDFVAFKKQ